MSSPQQDKTLQINFEYEGRTVPVSITRDVEESEPIDVQGVDYLPRFELEERDLNPRDPQSLTKFLASISRGSDHVYVWCYDAAWRKLLALVGVDYPLPTEPIKWPKSERD